MLRTEAFRSSAVAAAILAVATLGLFAFIYWQSAGYETRRIELFLAHEQRAIARQTPDEIIRDVELRYSNDLHRVTFAAVLDAQGRAIAGDISALPHAFPLDGQPHRTRVLRASLGGTATEAVIAVGSRLPDGRVLMVGRSADELGMLRDVVLRALELGLIPGILLALTGGALLSLRTLSRVRMTSRALERILDGHFDERLPARGTADPLDRLGHEVNRVLDEIGRLLDEVRGVGDDIAHDLRTPLARLRARLEGGRRRAASHEALGQVVDAALTDLDQIFGIITALLRIGEIEASRRQAGFSEVNLTLIATEVAELYQPIAELKDIALTVSAAPGLAVRGDRELLFEVAANLADNAIKFTPHGGMVRISVAPGARGPVLRVADSGPGIPAEERASVMKRFYRADKSRQVQGSGLGLSIVGAILRLHGFTLAMSDSAPGFAMDVVCLSS